MTMDIRAEQPADTAAIRAVTSAAFETAPHSGGNEADIVEALRTSGALTLSLVAVHREQVVGHVAFSPIEVAGTVEAWFGLGPVSVSPDFQRMGVGLGLIREGLSRLRAQGAGGCVVLGEPDYYGRFGFDSDPALRFLDEPSPYFQRLVFSGAPPEGLVRYHPAFYA